MKHDPDYTTNVVDGVPVGVAVDVIDREVLEALAKMDATHPIIPLRDESAEWETQTAKHPDWEPVANVDISVDTPEDYWRLTDAVVAVGPDPLAVAEWIQKHTT